MRNHLRLAGSAGLALATVSFALGQSNLKPGDSAPALSGHSEVGKPFNLKSVWKKHPVVLAFYKGFW